MTETGVHDRLEVIGRQKTINGEDILLTQFKNLKAKRELKQEVLSRFNNHYFRSVIAPRKVDRNLKVNALGRLSSKKHKGFNSDQKATIERADSFAKKSINTISVFPSVITQAYTILLSKEGDKVFDAFMGHNSRGEDIILLKRSYYAYDVHVFPVEFTKKALKSYPNGVHELNLGSSEKVKYPDNTFDFSITCPPYSDVEKYNKIYNEDVENDISSLNYNEFLGIYEKCLKETYRVLKRGKYFVLVVGNFFKNKRLYNLMKDSIDICQNAGFILHDINIYNRMSNIGGDLNYKLFINTLKRFPTIHEYILVFKKPEETPLPEFQEKNEDMIYGLQCFVEGSKNIS